MRIGNGYDVHKLTEGRDLIIGGVRIEFKLGLLGHSDADVLVHAVIDSLFGAAGLRDIGTHFPDSDPEYKDVSSIDLLCKTGRLLREAGYNIINVDSIVVAQSPKLSPYIEEMEVRIAEALRINKNQISVKAKTEEGLGFTGSSEGIKAYAVSLID